jgi:hypothetical protein
MVGEQGMNREDIIRLAREVGLWPAVTDMFPKELERFARLVIAHERTRLKEELAPSGSFVSWNNTKCNPLADPMMQSQSAWEDGYASGVAAERKAAWEAVNALIVPGDIGGDGTDPTAQRNGIVLAANALMSRIDAIRAGGKE